jgi:hypothetical protein
VPKEKGGVTRHEPISQTAEEARKRGRTWYISNIPCNIHGTKSRWARNMKCMGCVDFEGRPYSVVIREREPDYSEGGK